MHKEVDSSSFYINNDSDSTEIMWGKNIQCHLKLEGSSTDHCCGETLEYSCYELISITTRRFLREWLAAHYLSDAVADKVLTHIWAADLCWACSRQRHPSRCCTLKTSHHRLNISWTRCGDIDWAEGSCHEPSPLFTPFSRGWAHLCWQRTRQMDVIQSHIQLFLSLLCRWVTSLLHFHGESFIRCRVKDWPPLIPASCLRMSVTHPPWLPLRRIRRRTFREEQMSFFRFKFVSLFFSTSLEDKTPPESLKC